MKKVRFYVGIILIILAVGYMLFIRFTNIDMTDTRLFLTFWWQLILCAASIITGATLIIIKGENK